MLCAFGPSFGHKGLGLIAAGSHARDVKRDAVISTERHGTCDLVHTMQCHNIMRLAACKTLAIAKGFVAETAMRARVGLIVHW